MTWPQSPPPTASYPNLVEVYRVLDSLAPPCPVCERQSEWSLCPVCHGRRVLRHNVDPEELGESLQTRGVLPARAFDDPLRQFDCCVLRAVDSWETENGETVCVTCGHTKESHPSRAPLLLPDLVSWASMSFASIQKVEELIQETWRLTYPSSSLRGVVWVSGSPNPWHAPWLHPNAAENSIRAYQEMLMRRRPTQSWGSDLRSWSTAIAWHTNRTNRSKMGPIYNEILKHGVTVTFMERQGLAHCTYAQPPQVGVWWSTRNTLSTQPAAQ